MKRLLSLFISFILILCFSVNCFAYKHAPAYVSVDSENMPENTAYVDVLLPHGAFNGKFTEFNENCEISSDYRFVAGVSQDIGIPVELHADSEIAQYSADGYYSFLSHFDSATTEFYSDLILNYHDYYYGSDEEADFTADFAVKAQDADYTNPFDLFQHAESVKFAYVDENGNILKVTQEVSLKDKPFSGRYLDRVLLSGESVSAEYYSHPLFFVVYIFLSSASIVLVTVIILKVKKKPQNAE